MRRNNFLAFFAQEDEGIGSAAEAACGSYHSIENRLKVGWRPRNNAQDVGRGCLPFQRLALLGQQPRVFHGKGGLVGEALQYRDLLVGEGPYFLAVDGDHTEKHAVFAQGDNQDGAGAAEVD